MCDEQRIQHDQRADFTSEVERIHDARESAGSTAAEYRGLLAVKIAAKTELDRKSTDTWDEFWRHGQEYLNRCLEVLFTEEWCLSHGDCVAIRTALDTYNLLKRRRQELRELKLERAWTRHQSGGHDLDDRIRHLQILVELTEDKQREFHEEIVSEYFEPMLRSAGKLDHWTVPERSESRRQSSETTSHVDTLSLPRSPDVQHDFQTLDSQFYPPESNSQQSPDSSGGRAELHLNYERALDRLLGVQNALYAYAEKWQTAELSHLQAFPRSSKMRYSQLRDFDTKGLKEDMQAAEEELQVAVDSLTEHGFRVPSTRSLSSSQRSQRSSDREHARSSGSFNSSVRSGKLTYAERRRLGRINRWRSLSRPDDLALSPATPPTAQTEVTNGADGPSPPPSTPTTPSSGRKRKLREYSEMQEELRDKADKIARVATTVAGGSDSLRSGRTRES
ncbi:unnamed protein product [Cercospora beticola]|nr:unnamed protein product [Cercospora beticola]